MNLSISSLMSLLLVALGMIWIDPLLAEKNSGNARLSEQGLLLIGSVTREPTMDYPEFKTLADYLVKHLRDLGITRAEIRFTKSRAEMIGLIRQSGVDLVPQSMFSALRYRAEAGAELMLHEWRDGLARYRSIVIARKDSRMQDLSSLTGKVIAFEDPGSSSGYFLPRAHMEHRGLELLKLNNPRQMPRKEAIGYVFAQDEINISTWVYQGLVHAGALSSDDWEDPKSVPPAFKDELTIVARTTSLPRSFMVGRGDLPMRLKQRIKQVLSTVHLSPRAQAALAPYRGVTRYDEISDEDMAEIERLEAVLQKFRRVP